MVFQETLLSLTVRYLTFCNQFTHETYILQIHWTFDIRYIGISLAEHENHWAKPWFEVAREARPKWACRASAATAQSVVSQFKDRCYDTFRKSEEIRQEVFMSWDNAHSSGSAEMANHVYLHHFRQFIYLGFNNKKKKKSRYSCQQKSVRGLTSR